MQNPQRSTPGDGDDGDVTEMERWFGVNLAAMREHRGWSQTALGKLMAARGFPFHQTTISRIESGTRAVRIGEATALATLLRVKVEDLTAEPEQFRAVRHLTDAVAKLREPLERIERATADALHARDWLRGYLADAAEMVPTSKASPWETEPIIEAGTALLDRSPEDALTDGRYLYNREADRGDNYHLAAEQAADEGRY